MSKTTTRIAGRRQELLHELREAIPIFRNNTDQELLDFCSLSAQTLLADCTWEGIPWAVTCLHYYCLGIRAARARARGRFPDGSAYGSDNPEATTPPYSQILATKCAQDTP